MPVICTPQENYDHLQKLELFDFDDISSELPVGLLNVVTFNALYG